LPGSVLGVYVLAPSVRVVLCRASLQLNQQTATWRLLSLKLEILSMAVTLLCCRCSIAGSCRARGWLVWLEYHGRAAGVLSLPAAVPFLQCVV
jgi:hypothetical protein